MSKPFKFKNKYLLEWLNNKEEDFVPYYLSKYDFLLDYGRRCKNQPTNVKCDLYNKDENTCIGGRELRCQYSNGECIKVIKSICKYYDPVTKRPIEKYWSREQVKFIDDQYKLASRLEYGKAIQPIYEKKSSRYFKLFKSSNNASNTSNFVKTNAFQCIYNYFELMSPTKNKKKKNKEPTVIPTCYSDIYEILQKHTTFIDEINEQRGAIYKKQYKEPMTIPKTRIFLPEMSLYVFETIRATKKSKSVATMFTHDAKIDSQIMETLQRYNNQPTDPTPPTTTTTIPPPKPTFVDLPETDLFITGEKDSMSTILWNLTNTIYSFVKNSTVYMGKLAMTFLHYVIINYKQIVFIIFGIAIFFSISFFAVDFILPWIISAMEAKDKLYDFFNFFGTEKSQQSFYLLIFKKVASWKPLISELFLLSRSLMCACLPLIENNLLNAAFIGKLLIKYGKEPSVVKSFSFVSNIAKDFGAVNAVIIAIKVMFNCKQNYIADANGNMIPIKDPRGIFTRRWQYITQVYNTLNGSGTFPKFSSFFLKYRDSNVLFKILNSLDLLKVLLQILKNIFNPFTYPVNTDIEKIAEQGNAWLYETFVVGPDGQMGAALDIGTAVNNQFTGVIDVGETIFQRFAGIYQLKSWLFIAVISGGLIEYMNDDTPLKKGMKRITARATMRKSSSENIKEIILPTKTSNNNETKKNILVNNNTKAAAATTGPSVKPKTGPSVKQNETKKKPSKSNTPKDNSNSKTKKPITKTVRFQISPSKMQTGAKTKKDENK